MVDPAGIDRKKMLLPGESCLSVNRWKAAVSRGHSTHSNELGLYHIPQRTHIEEGLNIENGLDSYRNIIDSLYLKSPRN